MRERKAKAAPGGFAAEHDFTRRKAAVEQMTVRGISVLHSRREGMLRRKAVRCREHTAARCCSKDASKPNGVFDVPRGVPAAVQVKDRAAFRVIALRQNPGRLKLAECMRHKLHPCAYGARAEPPELILRIAGERYATLAHQKRREPEVHAEPYVCNTGHGSSLGSICGKGERC